MTVLFASLLSIIAAALFIWAAAVEPHLTLKTRRVKIPLKNWNEKLDGLKAAVIGDIHAGKGPHERRRIRRVIDKANSLDPDIILLVGDYVNGVIYKYAMEHKAYSKILSRLKAPLGVYAVLGNHDTCYGAEDVKKILRDAGITVLENSNLKISTPKGDFYIAGISDPIAGGHSFEDAFKDIPEGSPTILLSHTPDVLRKIPQGTSVMFSGHTHGGQVVVPFFGPPMPGSAHGKKYSGGLVREDGKTAHVTRGVGTSSLPVRFCCPPEITLATLVKEKPQT